LFDAGQRPLFAYGQWEASVMAQERGPIALRDVSGKGGYGYNASHDLSGVADHLIRLRLDVGDTNEARQLRVLLRDDDGTSGRFDFELPDTAGDVELRPTDATAVASPNLITADGADAELNIEAIQQVQVLGDWRDPPLDVTVLGVAVTAPDADDERARQAKRAKDAEAQKDVEQRTQDALATIDRGDGAPQVIHIAPLSPNLLQLTIRAGMIPDVELEPYEPKEGDKISPNPQHEAVAWTEGQGEGELAVEAEQVRLFRTIEGRRQLVGFLTGDGGYLLPVETVVGDPLHPLLVDRVEGYAISSGDFKQVHPITVHRKSKPINMTHPDRQAAMEHRVILELSEPLQADRRYTVHLSGVNTQRESIEYVHDPRNTRSDAVHASHLGYAPNDPYKVAFLSTWLGTGGGMTYDVDKFELIDGAGEIAYTGNVREIKAEGEAETLRGQKDYTQTAVYALDFSDFDEPGTYRAFVPGIGTSGPLSIHDAAWSSAFATSMMGLLHHRSGIELGEPLTSYERPRPHHPADGVEIFELESTSIEGEAKTVNEEAKQVVASSDKPPTHDGAWGGHMDAGDFDRNSRHLPMTHLLLELYELFPDYFAERELAVPVEEADNGLPDLLDEALWTIDFFARLQRDDGGVGGGVEMSAHPRDAETSWMDSLFVGTFAPGPYASYAFAANAAKASRLVEPFDAARAAIYAERAKRAWQWAEEHAAEHRERSPGKVWMIDQQRELAAVELLHLTGEQAYDDAFREASALGVGTGDVYEPSAFAYARLPDGIGDDDTRAKAKDAIIDLADRALAFGDGNAFGISTPYPNIPMIGFVGYFSTPGITSRALPRAHALTGDEKYLAGTIRSANFAAGANPDNMVYTTGLGWKSPQNPLHLDHRRTGQPAPAGITVYGPGDPAGGFAGSEWMHTYFLTDQMTPPSRTWPPQEFYVDAFMWPEMAEYTIHQTIAPSAYTWGYLAAQAAGR
jgi:endoglucanase